MRSVLLIAAAAAALCACGRAADGRPSADLSRDSGVSGAGTGPSTRVALAPSPGPNTRAPNDSTQNNNGPSAGGPH